MRTTYLTSKAASPSLEQRQQRGLDLALPGPAHLVVVVLDRQAHGVEPLAACSERRLCRWSRGGMAW